MATQISAASPSPNFHSEKSCVKKISVYCLKKKFGLEVVRVGILGTGYYFQGSH